MERSLRKKRIGRVVSDKMEKTIVVAVETKVDTHYTVRQLIELQSLKYMMRIMKLKLMIEYQ